MKIKFNTPLHQMFINMMLNGSWLISSTDRLAVTFRLVMTVGVLGYVAYVGYLKGIWFLLIAVAFGLVLALILRVACAYTYRSLGLPSEKQELPTTTFHKETEPGAGPSTLQKMYLDQTPLYENQETEPRPENYLPTWRDGYRNK